MFKYRQVLRRRCHLSGASTRFVPTSKCLMVLGVALLLSGCHKPGSNNADSAAVVPKSPVKTVAAPATIPLPPLPEGGVRGIYVTGWVAGLHNRFNALCGLVDRTELNAMVIDVRDDGEISYKADIPLAIDSHACVKKYDVDKVISTLNEHHIWPIARIACMRDTPLAKAHPELAVHGPDGQVWHDRSKHYWLNPYKKEVWDYNVDVALDALKHGFKEIQFDYVRFPSEGKISTLQYPGKPPGSKRTDQINAFLKYASAKIHAQGGWFSADVFGLTPTVERRYRLRHPEAAAQTTGAKPTGAGATPGTTPPTAIPVTGAAATMRPTASAIPAGDKTVAANGGKSGKMGASGSSKSAKNAPVDKIAEDMGIGQMFSKMAANMNYMCPMTYPSHYAHGEFGIASPNAEPYKVILKSVGDAKDLIADVPNCKLRPWIQDFTLGPPHYGPNEVKAQIKALHDLGIHEYLLWNAGCKFTEAALAKKATKQ